MYKKSSEKNEMDNKKKQRKSQYSKGVKLKTKIQDKKKIQIR